MFLKLASPNKFKANFLNLAFITLCRSSKDIVKNIVSKCQAIKISKKAQTHLGKSWINHI